MKPYKTAFQAKLFLKYLTAFTILLLASCSQIGPKPEPISEQEACNRLQGLIADHPKQFVNYRSNKRVLRSLNRWTGTKVFPMANNCQVWEWSNGLFSYICNWKSDDGMEGAKKDYTEGERIMRSCLSKEWQSVTQTTRNDGEYTLFTQPDLSTVVEIRFFKEPRSIIENWHTTVIISDESNLKAKLQ